MPDSITDPIVVALEGELEIARVEDVREALDQAAGEGSGGLVVDLSDISFIDSSGLGAVVEMHDRLRREHRQLTVVAPRGSSAAVVLTLTGLRGRLPVAESLRSALDA
jgi:anti-sigma B factor antagonist